jgi:hypothetical protein
MAAGYGLDDRESRLFFRQGQEVLLYSAASRPALGPTQLPLQLIPQAVSLVVKRREREAYHSPLSARESQ